jgi:predicted glycosyltransferase involved in capsule biosynthesis
MAKRKHWSHRTPKEKLVVLIQDLACLVERFEKLYAKHPELQNQIDISDLLPISYGERSFSEWLSQINDCLDKEYRQAQD